MSTWSTILLHEAEYERLMNRNREARKRALCGAGPRTSKRHGAKPAKQKLSRPPVEHIGNLTRVVAAIHMLRGRNKLDVRQSMAAETYRDAFETVHRSLGNAMDFSGVELARRRQAPGDRSSGG